MNPHHVAAVVMGVIIVGLLVWGLWPAFCPTGAQRLAELDRDRFDAHADQALAVTQPRPQSHTPIFDTTVDYLAAVEAKRDLTDDRLAEWLGDAK